MRQILFSVLMTLIVVGSAEVQSLAEVTPKTADSANDSQETMLGQAPALSKSIGAESLVVVQKMPSERPQDAPKTTDKDTPKTTDKDTPKTTDKDTPKQVPSERIDVYECIEYCAVVRQSCDGLAAIQPDVKIAKIGSKENNNLSRDCQKIYLGCTNQCDVDDSKVNWKRGNPKKSKTKR